MKVYVEVVILCNSYNTGKTAFPDTYVHTISEGA